MVFGQPMSSKHTKTSSFCFQNIFVTMGASEANFSKSGCKELIRVKINSRLHFSEHLDSIVNEIGRKIIAL